MTTTATHPFDLIGTRSHGDLRVETLLATAVSTLDELGASHIKVTQRADFYAELSTIAGGDLDPEVVDNMHWLADEVDYMIHEALPRGLYYGHGLDPTEIGIWLDDPEDWCPACGIGFDDEVDEDLPHCVVPTCWFDMRLLR